MDKKWEPDLGGSLAGRVEIQTAPSVWEESPALADLSFHTLGRRQAFWQQKATKISAYPIEFLLPRINIAYRDKLPAVMQSAEAAYQERPDTFRQLTELDWGYYFYLGGGHSTKDKEEGVDAARALSILRFQMINDAVAKILGDDLKNSTLIDFASNWGAFPIDMASRGMTACVGFDIRRENVAKAQLLADYLGVSNVSFDVCNVYDVLKKFGRRFDVVYNLGLLYHVTDPFSLMKITYDTCDRMAVVDTLATREPFSGFLNNAVASAQQAEHAKGHDEIELRPTYRAVIDLMHAVGFRDLVEVTVDLGETFPTSRVRTIYEMHHRRVVIEFK